MSNDYLDKINRWDSYIDLTLSEIDNLLLEINHVNLTSYTRDDIELGLPEYTRIANVGEDPNKAIETNTKVLVSPKPGSDLRGSDYFHYRRIDIEKQWNIHNDHSNVISLPAGVTDEREIKRFLRKNLPIHMSSVHVRIEEMGGQDYLRVEPLFNSYLYIGNLTLLRADIDSPIAKVKRMGNIQGIDYYTDHTGLRLPGLDYYQS